MNLKAHLYSWQMQPLLDNRRYHQIIALQNAARTSQTPQRDLTRYWPPISKCSNGQFAPFKIPSSLLNTHKDPSLLSSSSQYEVSVNSYTYFVYLCVDSVSCQFIYSMGSLSTGHVFTFMYISINIMINDKSSD